MLYLYGRSGTTYLYIHLNNDLTEKSEDRGGCVPGVAYATGLHDGGKVRTGQLIAFVGDSGDAEGVGHHLHFEIHPGDGAAISPYKALRRARHLLFAGWDGADAAAAAQPLSLALHGTAIAFDGTLLTVQVTKVRMSDGTRLGVEQQVAVAVPADAVVERATDRGRRPVVVSDVPLGEQVVVWTRPVRGDLDEQRGEAGALVAAHVLFRTA
jgi:hypothetical protein